jgi:hypothetical protein
MMDDGDGDGDGGPTRLASIKYSFSPTFDAVLHARDLTFGLSFSIANIPSAHPKDP